MIHTDMVGTIDLPLDWVHRTWAHLGLPLASLDGVSLEPITHRHVRSSYAINELAQASIALSTLAAAHLQSLRTGDPIRSISVDPLHAAIEFASEKYTWVDGEPPGPLWGPLSGLYECSDGYVRLHDGFSNHRQLIVQTFGCEPSQESLEGILKGWKKGDVEDTAEKAGFAGYVLRSEGEWNRLVQAKRIEHPIRLTKRLSSSPLFSPSWSGAKIDEIRQKPLTGLRVVELSRVLAAPVAGRTLAWHGADVIWVTSPNLPDLPSSDRDVSRGKRTVQLDLDVPADREALKSLVKDADVFIQSYRPESLTRRGFGEEQLRKLNPGLIYASLSAWSDGPWSHRRGFDSLVQTATGLNISEAQAAGQGEIARPLPCQALDHAAGYFLAAGIMAAAAHRTKEGGAWDVHVSLQGCMDRLKSLGRAEHGFEEEPFSLDDVERFIEERETGLGWMKAVKHAGVIDGCQSGFVHMPKPLGSDEPAW